MNNIKQKLPTIYQLFFPEWINWEVPIEKWANCNSCLLIQQDKNVYSGTKCCTYYPNLMNYMVGGLLKDENPLLELGQNQVRKMISGKKGISPFGVLTTEKYQNYRQKIEKKRRKRAEKGKEKKWSYKEVSSLRCPYYRNGFCSIWAYREHCCSTHFCVSVAGTTGKFFWNVLNNYLIQVENKLSKYALLEIGYPVENIPTDRINSKRFNLEDKKGNINEMTYQELWGKWLGEEEGLYLQCYEIISQLTPEKFQSIMGLEGEILEKSLAKHRTQFINPPIPDVLQKNSQIEISEPKENGFVIIKNLDNKRSMRVPPFVLNILDQFDGKSSTQDILEKNGPLSKFYKTDFLIPLYKTGILQEKIKPEAISLSA